MPHPCRVSRTSGFEFKKVEPRNRKLGNSKSSSKAEFDELTKAWVKAIGNICYKTESLVMPVFRF